MIVVIPRRKSDAALGALIGTVLINVILWLFFSTNAGALDILSVTWPSLPLGAGLGILWNRWVLKGSSR